MPTDYSLIEKENRERYGWDIKRIGDMLLADRYSDRTHFIYELLQNAEDAISWRDANSKLPKSVSFVLDQNALQFSHFGLPFEKKHVESICGIGQSTKTGELTTIGRFGIGFKSVYSFCDRPEIHSGQENFAICDYVLPHQIDSTPTEENQTVFNLPFKANDAHAYQQILGRLKGLGHRSLLFLKHIESIEWKATSGGGGTYLRDSKLISSGVRKVTLIGQRTGAKDMVSESWLVFSRDVQHENQPAGQVEIAYALDGDSKIRPIADSDLVVFFPTEKATNLGFLVQGPYRTTPSRDNVPKDDAWNRHLVAETTILVQESLRKLKSMGMLTTDVLHAMPIDQSKFSNYLGSAGADSMFRPIFLGVIDSLSKEELLSTYGGGFTSGKKAKIARSDALRKLLNPTQLGQLHGLDADLFWLTDEITRDKTAQLRGFLMAELQINEIDPDAFATRFGKEFIEKQPDDWVARFYTFLNDQPALWRTAGLRIKPIIRLESGIHAAPFDPSGHANAFLPTTSQSGFPLVKKAVCREPQALAFLKQLGLTEPDPVDDVIVNVLPIFKNPQKNPLAEIDYNRIFNRILTASQTDSSSRREKLIKKLKTTPFVRCRNAQTRAINNRDPESVYLASEKLATLFKDNPDIWLVDDTCTVLKGELARNLLEACGTRDYLRKVEATYQYDYEELHNIRKSKGSINFTHNNVQDFDVVGLKFAVEQISKQSGPAAQASGLNLWQVLLDTLREARESFFQANYSWSYYQNVSTATFPSKFLKCLRSTPWLSAPDGQLKAPTEFRFSELPEKFQALPSVTMQELLGFKPEVIQQLAAEAGIDPATIDLLKKHDITAAKLLELLQKNGLVAAPKSAPESPPAELGESEEEDAEREITDTEQANSAPDHSQTESQPTGKNNGSGVTGGASSGGKSTIHHPQDGEFITYLYTKPDDYDEDEADANAGQRVKNGRQGVEAVLKFEREAGRFPDAMPQTHEGCDVISKDANGYIERYIEVKTPGSSWGKRGVTLSYPQFQAAQANEKDFWLYVVEDVGQPSQRIYRIQNPACQTKYFSYDIGWRELAESD